MKVILLQELKGKGGEGDVIEAARGFAVNYLFPRGIAIEATPGNLKQLEQRKHNIEKREAGRIEDADALKASIENKTINVVAKVGEEGQLFGSVTTAAIAEAVKEQLGIELDKKKIDLRGAIKTAGIHEASISIYRDIKAIISINVGSEEMFAAAAAEEAAAEEAAAEAEAEAVEAEAEVEAEAAEAEEVAEA